MLYKIAELDKSMNTDKVDDIINTHLRQALIFIARDLQANFRRSDVVAIADDEPEVQNFLDSSNEFIWSEILSPDFVDIARINSNLLPLKRKPRMDT